MTQGSYEAQTNIWRVVVDFVIRAGHMSNDECEHYAMLMLEWPFKLVLCNNQSQCREFR